MEHEKDFFYKHHWDRLPEAWRESLNCLTTAELNTCLLDREATGSTSHVLPLSLLCFKACTQAFSLDRRCHTDLDGVLHSLFSPEDNGDLDRNSQTDVNEDEVLLLKTDEPGCRSATDIKKLLTPTAQDGSLHSFFKKHVKPKKQHEIIQLGKVINLLSEHVGCGHVVDVGAGLGHLSRLLSFGYGLGVTSVEASGTHAPKASKFDSEIDREIKKKHMKMENPSSTGSTHTDPPTSLPHHVTSRIEANMTTNDFLTIIRTQQHSELCLNREPEFSSKPDHEEHKDKPVRSASQQDNCHRDNPDAQQEPGGCHNDVVNMGHDCCHRQGLIVCHSDSVETRHETKNIFHKCANMEVDSSSHDNHITVPFVPDGFERQHCCDSSIDQISIDDVNSQLGRKRRDSESMCEIEPKSPKLERSFPFDSLNVKCKSCYCSTERSEDLKESNHIYGGNRSAQVPELEQNTATAVCESDEADITMNDVVKDKDRDPTNEDTTVDTMDGVIMNNGLDKGPDSSFILTGLHACGDLTPTFLRFYLNCEAAKGLASVGCCYMKLTIDSSRETVGYPMSEHVTSLPDHHLSFNALELACHFADTYAKRLTDSAPHLKIHSYRAALEWLANQMCPNFQRSAVQIPSKKTNQMDFKTYASVGLTKLGLPVDQVSSDLMTRTEKMTERWRDVVAFYTLRLSLAPVVESLVLIDRMLYLYENGLASALVPIFDPGLSPRNFVLLSGKQAHSWRMATQKGRVNK